MLGAGFTINLLQRGAASLGRINSILRQEPDIKDLPGTEQVPDRLPAVPPAGIADLLSVTTETGTTPAVALPGTGPVVPDVLFHDLSYNYPGTAPTVLSHISLHIPAGQWLGILGRTGAGKSTLVKLLPRLLDPPPGTIFIDNRDIRTLPLKKLRALTVMVPQDTFLFSASILENIALDRLGEADITELQQVVALATMDRDLAGFPRGWDTIVGERGITLSGGQKQRVALARALLSRASLVILDDAFAAVDTETEARILQGLAGLLKNKTVILISHRVSTLKRAAAIIVLEQGRIIQQGTHKELLQDKHGFYAETYRAQQLEAALG
jgi:ATP-binding cassette subfamily B protein